MNLVEAALGVAGVLTAISLVGALVAPRTVRPAVVGAGTALGGVAGVVAGAAALSGQGLSVVLPGLLPLAGVLLTVDALSGVFVVVVGAVAVAVGIYGIGYARNGLGGRGAQAMVPLFVVAMLLVPIAGSAGTFLLCWELMALASLLLVLAQHRSRDEVASAARWYAAPITARI